MTEIPATIVDPSRRQEFVLLFDATHANPNGDPDAANVPRTDPETGHGLVSDVSMKRKIRDYVTMVGAGDIFIQSETALNTLKSRSAEALDPPLTSDERKSSRPVGRLRDKLCADYYDVRLFGGVLTTGDKEDRLNAGQVVGPVQLTFARSIDPVQLLNVGITRQGRTTEGRMTTGPTEMGTRPMVAYGLYRAHGYVNPFLSQKQGVSAKDLEVFWQALANLFEHSRSAGRTELAVQGIYVFTHDNALGRAPAHRLLRRVTVTRRNNGEPPRSIDDYEVTVDEGSMPTGVTLTRLAD